MFNFIRRHQAMALVFILLVCFSFVVFFTSDNVFDVLGTGSGAGNYGSIDGEAIDGSDFMNAYEETILQHYLYYGRFPSGDTGEFGFDVQNETLNRLFLIRKIDELGIKPDDKVVAKYISNLFTAEGEAFNKDLYQQFTTNVLRRASLTVQDFHRYARHEVGRQHLITVMGSAGQLVSPLEAEELYKEQNQKVDVSAVFFTSADHINSVTLNPDAIARYYTNMMSRYRLPDRRSVSYLVFESTNYWFDAEEAVANDPDLPTTLDERYEERGAEFFKADDGAILPEEEAKEQLKQQLTQEKAFAMARDEAIAFGEKLFEMEPMDMGNMDRLAAAEGYLTDVTEPFTRNEGPTDLDVATDNFARFAFGLTDEEPFSPPIIDDEEIYILGMMSILPSQVPPLAEVEDRVSQDYRESQARSLARIAANSFYNTLTNQLAQGAPIQQVCEQQQKELVDIPTFTRNDTFLPAADPRFDVRRAQTVVFDMEPGEASRFISTTDGGFIVYLRDKQPVGDDELSEKLDEFIAELGDQRRAQAFSEWFLKEQELARILAPGAAAEAQDSPGSTNSSPPTAAN